MSTWEELETWWGDLAHDEVHRIIDKAQEYGGMHRAQDLLEIGRHLVTAGVRVPGDHLEAPSDAQLAELGCYYYLVGKMARWTAAVQEGRLVSDDTLHDIGVYSRMVQRIRHSGGWPV